MGCILSTCFFNHVHVLKDDVISNFNVENSLPCFLKVHLDEGITTSANFKMMVLAPDLTGSEYVIYEYVCRSKRYISFSKVYLIFITLT